MSSTKTYRRLDADDVKLAAAGRWVDILSAVAGIDSEILDGRKHPCPKCGGTKRFRLINEAAGAVICSHCFTEENGDGLAAVGWMLGIDFPSVVRVVGEFLNLDGAASQTAKRGLSDQFDPITNGLQHDLFRQFAQSKPPITADAVAAAGGIAVRWPKRSQGDSRCIAWPATDDHGHNRGWILRRVNGENFPAIRDLEERKTHMLKGSRDGWIIPGGLARLKSAEVVWRVEGLPDAIALYPMLPPDHAVFTNICGAKSVPPFLGPFAGKIVYVVGDADRPGEDGAAKYAAKLSRIAAEVRQVRLPFAITGNEGKDLRDFFNEGGTFEQLQELADAAEVIVATEQTESSEPGSEDTPVVNEAADDPHRLAREFIKLRNTLNDESTLLFHRGEFLTWTANAWRPLSLAEMKSGLSGFIKSQFDAANLIAQRLAEPGEAAPECRKVTRSLIENVVQALSSLVLLPGGVDAPAWLVQQTDDRPASEMLAMKSQLLHLPSAGGGDCTVPATPRFFSSTSLEFDYDPAAGCPQWLAFLDSIWPTDSESIETLQQWFGYCLQDCCGLQKLLMLIGPPRSGKGTIARVLRSLLGAANIASPTLGSLADQFGLASLVGKRVAIIADARLSGRADAVAVVERLLSITGEDSQDVQRKHQTTLAGVRLPVKFFILANELPNLRDTAGALLSRTVLLRMTRSFSGREDRGLESRLLAELPGILNWSLQGLQTLRQRGEFVQPGSAKELLDDLEDLASPTGMFIKDRCIVGPEFTATPAELFAEWQKWCEEYGRDHAGTQQTFCRDLRAAMPHLSMKNHRAQGVRERLYYGIGLRANYAGSQWNAIISIARVAEETNSQEVERASMYESRERNREDRDPPRSSAEPPPRLNREDMPKRPPWLNGGG